MKRELDHLATLPAHGRRLREEDRLHRPVLHRAQAQGADQAPVRLRRGRLHQLPAGVRPGRALQAQHRDQPRHAGRPHVRSTNWNTPAAKASWARSTPTAATCCSAGTPTSSRPTSTTRRMIDADDPEVRRLHDRRPQLRRQGRAARASSRSTCSTPTSAAWTPSPGA